LHRREKCFCCHVCHTDGVLSEYLQPLRPTRLAEMCHLDIKEFFCHEPGYIQVLYCTVNDVLATVQPEHHLRYFSMLQILDPVVFVVEEIIVLGTDHFQTG
jgi:hypothetical protein